MGPCGFIHMSCDMWTEVWPYPKLVGIWISVYVLGLSILPEEGCCFFRGHRNRYLFEFKVYWIQFMCAGRIWPRRYGRQSTLAPTCNSELGMNENYFNGWMIMFLWVDFVLFTNILALNRFWYCKKFFFSYQSFILSDDMVTSPFIFWHCWSRELVQLWLYQL